MLFYAHVFMKNRIMNYATLYSLHILHLMLDLIILLHLRYFNLHLCLHFTQSIYFCVDLFPTPYTVHAFTHQNTVYFRGYTLFNAKFDSVDKSFTVWDRFTHTHKYVTFFTHGWEVPERITHISLRRFYLFLDLILWLYTLQQLYRIRQVIFYLRHRLQI